MHQRDGLIVTTLGAKSLFEYQSAANRGNDDR